jgi:micrococcal nuclease
VGAAQRFADVPGGRRRASFLAVLVVAVGCASWPQAATVPDAALRGDIAVPASARETSVVRVVDGDTVVLRDLGTSRLIGVDTPEVYGARECFGREASAFARRLLASGTRVRYLAGADPRDRYGRRLVYLWLADGRSFNAMLVEGGYATALSIAPNQRYAQRLRRLVRQAKRAERGRWSPGACGGP